MHLRTASTFAILAAAAMPAMASNLVVNGSFEQTAGVPGAETPVGFSTGYVLDSRDGQGLNGGSGAGYGYAGIVTDSQAWHPYFSSFGAQDGRKFLIVNGAGSDLPVWEQSVGGIDTNAAYEFSFWARSAFPASPATLTITADIDGAPIVFGADLSGDTSQWVRFSAVLSGLNNTTNFRIVDTNGEPSGNDFAIDNIQLVQVVPAPQHLAAGGLLLLAGLRRRR